MRTWLLTGIFACSLGATSVAWALPADEAVVPAGETPAAGAEQTEATGTPSAPAGPYKRWLPIVLHFRAGLPLQSEDPEVRSHWNHSIWDSYMAVLGAYYETPTVWGAWKLNVGPEFYYLHDAESLTSSLANSY